MSAFPTVLDMVRTADPAELPEIVGELERLKAIAYARMMPRPIAPAAAASTRMLTTNELAKAVGVSGWSIGEMVRRREIPADLIGRSGSHFRFEAAAVDKVKSILKRKGAANR